MKLGFVINPLAGIGGSVALKGSDGDAIVRSALERGAIPLAEDRAAMAMKVLTDFPCSHDGLTLYTAGGKMGENVLHTLGIACQTVYQPGKNSTVYDTRETLKIFLDKQVDLIIFAGGDGTARDVLDVLHRDKPSTVPVIGIPAGVKIHSAVYASTPLMAGELVSRILQGEQLSVHEAQVMDLDENAFRAGRVDSRCYGYLQVPVDDARMQSGKQGGLNPEELLVQDIAADVIDTMQDDVIYLIGSGSTTAEIMQQLSLKNTLLGVDIICNRELLAEDADEHRIMQLTEGRQVKMVITIIGGQGHLFGRGNQQLSPRVIRRVGKENIIIVASTEKLDSLCRRPMISDTGDSALDRQLSGLYQVITGYEQRILYRLQ